MKRNLLLFVFIAQALIAGAQSEISVNNAVEFVQAIGPNRVITMNAGTYNLQEATDITNANALWYDVFDGLELTVQSVQNLTIKAKGKVTVLAKPRYAWIINFIDCSNIKIIGVIAGHDESGYCTGGVFGFSNTKQVQIEKCEMYGSGTEGINAADCQNFTIKSCKIHDCTYDIMTLYHCQNFSFSACSFLKTGEFDIFMIQGCENVSFTKCLFAENWNGDFMPYLFNVDAVCKNIKIEGCKVKGNKVMKFVNDRARLQIKKTKFSGNSFKDFTDDFLNKNQK